MAKRIIYLFRNDLRISDNEAFIKATKQADEVIPVYVFDTRWFVETSLGFRKTGAIRTAFIVECVRSLQTELREMGLDLVIGIGEPETIVADLAKDLDASDVYMAKEIAFEETSVESSLSKRLKVINVDIEMIWMSTLYHPRDLPFWISKLPTTFEAYKGAIETNWAVRDLFPDPFGSKFPEELRSQDVPSLGALGFSDAEVGLIDFSALKAIAATDFEGSFFATLPTKEQEDDWAFLLFSGLSVGRLSPKQAYLGIHAAATSSPEDESADRWIDKLIWRDYLHFTALKYGSRIFKPSGIMQDINRKWERDSAAFDEWRSGRTGNGPVDEIMKEFGVTGRISERLSAKVADFLIDDLQTVWTWGASYFESQQIDFEVCHSWGTWNYYAGVGSASLKGAGNHSK